MNFIMVSRKIFVNNNLPGVDACGLGGGRRCIFFSRLVLDWVLGGDFLAGIAGPSLALAAYDKSKDPKGTVIYQP